MTIHIPSEIAHTPSQQKLNTKNDLKDPLTENIAFPTLSRKTAVYDGCCTWAYKPEVFRPLGFASWKAKFVPGYLNASNLIAQKEVMVVRQRML